MNTPLIEREPADSSEAGRIVHIDPPGGRRSWLFGIAAAAVVALAGAAVLGNIGGGDEPQIAAPPLELSLGDGDAMAMCLPFEVSILRDMSPAFAATATSVEPGVVTLEVDRWYTGGDADTVVLQTLDSSASLIAGFDFVVGEQYLITAAEGTVNFCGYSGIATPEMTAAFDAAFAG